MIWAHSWQFGTHTWHSEVMFRDKRKQHDHLTTSWQRQWRCYSSHLGAGVCWKDLIRLWRSWIWIKQVFLEFPFTKILLEVVPNEQCLKFEAFTIVICLENSILIAHQGTPKNTAPARMFPQCEINMFPCFFGLQGTLEPESLRTQPS